MEQIQKNTSFTCDWKKTQPYNKLFTSNQKVKFIFYNGINEILKEIYPNKYYGMNGYKKGDLPGIYDLEKPGRSVINKLNTNYTCFCILVNDVNRVLRSEGKKIIEILDKNTEEQISETKRFMDFIYEKKHRIFSPNSSTYQNLMKTLTKTDSYGDKTEDKVISKLKEKFGTDNVKKIGGLGSIGDATKGIDCEVYLDGNVYTIQIKPFNDLQTEGSNIILQGVSGVKKYNTDWLIFHNNKTNETKVFKNSDTQIINDNFVFFDKNLIASI